MSSSSTPGTFQVSTDQISNSQAEPVSSQFVQVGDDQVRIDGLGRSAAPHFRARQLNEFTTWLENKLPQQIQPEAGTHESSIESTGAGSTIPGAGSNTILRVDAPIASQSSRQPAKPHFDTRNYIEPEVDPAQAGITALPTDGFDPPNEILDTIQRLKADGRVIGDLHQPESPEGANLIVPGFKWPHVSTSLLGSPAILNLEMNVQQSITPKRNQVLVTSIGRGKGSSTVALTLARQMVAHGQKVLLIDADLANPMLASRLGLTHRLSWIQSVSDRRLPNEIIIREKNGLSLMPLTPVALKVGWPRKMYDAFAGLSNPIAWNYDAVVIDIGPFSQLISESSAPKIQSATTLVVSSNGSQGDENLELAKTGLQTFGINELLIVQNFSKVDSAVQARVG